MDIYREVILDHYKHPHNFGNLDHATASASLYNSACGDRIVMQMHVEKDIITDIRFSGVGCAISVASASMMTDAVKGKTTEEILQIKPSDVFAMLGTELTPARVKCAVLPLEVLQKALISVIK
jgi:nitrogen fixation NifU-like protein